MYIYIYIYILGVLKETVKHGEKTVKGKTVPTQEHVYTDADVSQDIKDAISDIFEPKANLTPEQKEIAELKSRLEKMDALLQSSTEPKTKPITDVKEPKKADANSNDNDVDDIGALRTTYITLTGEEPDKRWKEPRLIKEIETEKAKKS